MTGAAAGRVVIVGGVINLLGAFGESADIGFQEHGDLILGGENQVAEREAAAEMQRSMGADIQVMRPDELQACDFCVVAAGAWSGPLVANLGVALPVVPRKRTVFCFKTPLQHARPPMLFDASDIWVRPEGDGDIGGIQPPLNQEPDADGDFAPQDDLLEETYWPLLAARIPAMEELRLQRAWAGHDEVNTLDHNGVVGPQDALGNLIFAAGFSEHGVMHAPAVGQGVAELITTVGSRSIDLSPLGWARVRSVTPRFESIVY